MSDTPWPDPDDAAVLHRRLLAADPLAPPDFAAAVLDPLVRDLRAGNPRADDHHVIEAAGTAVLSVIRNPTLYDPARGDLPAFLRMAARGDLLNLRQREQRHRRNRADPDCVELVADGGNCPREDDRPSFDDPALAAVIAGFTDVERQVFELMRDGERRTEVFAAVLGVAGRSVEEQRDEVYRTKERIVKRLKRAVGGP
jgi:hypothetical protein